MPGPVSLPKARTRAVGPQRNVAGLVDEGGADRLALLGSEDDIPLLLEPGERAVHDELEGRGPGGEQAPEAAGDARLRL